MCADDPFGRINKDDAVQMFAIDRRQTSQSFFLQRESSPYLIYCAISGFGQSGPLRDRPAFDTVAQAASGCLRLLTPPANPRVIGAAIAVAVTGQYAAPGIMPALLERVKTGKGRQLDISMLEVMVHFNLDSFTHYYSVGEILGHLSRPVVSQSYTFECSDGKWIAIHMSSPTKFWEGLLEGSDEALEDPQAKHLKLAVSTHHPEMSDSTTVRAPYSFDHESDLNVLPPPTLDQHGEEIRNELKRRKTG